MLSALIIYFGIATLMVAAMTAMILKIGQLLAECPDNGPAVRAASITIATGYAMIGIGGVGLIGACITFTNTLLALSAALGMAAICLGLGFTHAIATLRAVVQDNPTIGDAPAPATPTAEASAA